jgi:alpha-L-rhamnosidase
MMKGYVMFIKAKPIYALQTYNELHTLSCFTATVHGLSGAKLYLCAADFYQVYVNGCFVAAGPARTAKGYARQDIISLDAYNREGDNKIVISVLSHNCCSLSTVRQQGYLWAEIVKDGEVLCATGEDFDCFIPECFERKTERYSVQRHFCEVWDLSKSGQCKSGEIAILRDAPTVIPRRAPYPYYEDVMCAQAASVGALTYDDTVTPRKQFWSFLPSERFGRFLPDEIVSYSYEWIQCQRQTVKQTKAALPLSMSEMEYAIFDFSRIETGMIRLCAEAVSDAEIIVAFTEDCTAEKFEFTDLHAHNVVEIRLGAGQRDDFVSFEPYVMRYAVVAIKKGAVRLERFGIKNYARDISGIEIPEIEDEALRNVYKGAVRTFAHNALDIFMDCPSRERAGWLCDSYFTAKTEYELYGSTQVEDAFLENFRLYRNEGEYPEGMLPMCFPSDVKDDGTFIPQWTLWYILETEDYLNNRGKSADRELFRDSIYGLLSFFAKYENSDGLLEKLPSWNFVEWSVANNWTQDVSYPTNFLYAQALECVYRIYGDQECKEKCERIRRTAVEQSFDGRVFLDHAVRNEQGELVRKKHCSEACQYYAILFGGIDIREQKYAELRRLVLNVFSAERTEEHPDIAEINAFIGAYLRMETLLKMGEYDILLEDIKDFFGCMESVTGTLWEYRQRHGSRDHGFASYALVAMKRALDALK